MHLKLKAVVPAAALALVVPAGALALSASTAGASTHHPMRPHPVGSSSFSPATTSPVAPVNDQFQAGTGGWCSVSDGCDGTSWGTIDRVPSGFTDGGGGSYGQNVTAVTGSYFAETTGTTDVNQGSGCPDPSVTESCTGPYYLPGGGNDFQFPANGFTVTDDLYLDVNAAGTGEIDADTALNSSSGTPFGAGGGGIDNTIAACSLGAGSGFQLSFGHGSPIGCSGSAAVTSSGWYRFVWIFSNVAGDVYLTEKVFTEGATPTLVASSGLLPIEFGSDSSAEPITNVGGPAYTWLPTLQVAGMLPMANYAIQTGQHGKGHTP